MVKISELANDWSVTGTEQVPLNDWWTTKKATTQDIADIANIPSSQVTDFDTAVDARINVPTDTAKTTPVDTDVFALWDTIRKKVTWANIKATLKTYFDTLYHTKNALRTWLTANQMLITDGSGNEWYANAAVMASDAEADTGTNQTKYINPKQAKNNVDRITGTRTWSSTGSQTLTHNLWKTPVFIYAIAKTNWYYISSFGMWCSEWNSSVSDLSAWVSIEPNLSDSVLINTSTISSNRSLNCSVTSVTTTDIVINWTTSWSGWSFYDVWYTFFVFW